MKLVALCFAPHPDDEILGCGGIIQRLKKFEVYICFLTYGENGIPYLSEHRTSQLRKTESIQACKKLGIKKENLIYLGLRDNSIDSNSRKDFMKINELIRRIKPNLVLIPSKEDLYHDHSEASKLIKRSLDMAGSNNFLKKGEKSHWVGNVLEYEVSTPFQDYSFSIDMTEKEMKNKIESLESYNSQKEKSGNKSDFIGEKVKYLAAFRAAYTIGKYREAFKVVRIDNLKDVN